MNKRGKKAGGFKRNSQLETMALAGILANGYDNLKWWERNFLKIVDEYDGGMILQPELYDKLELHCKGKWDRQKVYRVKLKLKKKISRLKGKYEAK